MEDLSNPTVQNQPEGNQRPAGQALGIAALITAIITFVMAVIPCIGIIAIIPGIIAIVLAGVGLSHAAHENAPRGVLVAGLIIGIIASLIAFSQIFVVGKITEKADKWPMEFQNVMEDVQKDITKELEDNNISIKVENGDKKIEITTNADKKDREQTLEDLEKGNEPAKDTTLVPKK